MNSGGALVRRELRVAGEDGTSLYARETCWSPEARSVPLADPGRLPLLCCNGVGVSTLFWPFFERRFGRQRPVICWDYPGHGRSASPRHLGRLSIESLADDLVRVLDAFGHERAILVGHSMGCQVIYTCAARHPTRVAALIPTMGTYGYPLSTFLGSELIGLTLFWLGRSAGLFAPTLVRWGLAKVLGGERRHLIAEWALSAGLVDRRMPSARLVAYLEHLGQRSPVVLLRLLERMAVHSARPFLPRLDVPALVVAASNDAFTPLHTSEEAADLLPQAELVVLEGGSHAALVEQPERLHAAIEEFLARHGLNDS